MPSCHCWRADMAVSYFQYRFEVFWSLMCFTTTRLLPARCLATAFSRDFSQHPSTRPATLYNITQGYKGDQKPWFYAQYFYEITHSGKHPPIVFGEHVWLLRNPLGAATHPPPRLYSLPVVTHRHSGLPLTLVVTGHSCRAQQNPKLVL